MSPTPKTADQPRAGVPFTAAVDGAFSAAQLGSEVNAALDRIAVRRLGVLALGGEEGVENAHVSAVGVLAELEKLGVAVRNPSQLGGELANWDVVRDEVARLRGGGRASAPLFDGFPDKLPDWDDAVLRFTLAKCRALAAVLETNGVEKLADIGVRADESESGDRVLMFEVSEEVWRDALDFSDLGWWPASSVPQDPVADEAAKAAQELRRRDKAVRWQLMEVVGLEERDRRLAAYTLELLYSAASHRAEVVDDLKVLLSAYGEHLDIDGERVVFAETRALLSAQMWAQAPEKLLALGLSPDDVLRMLAAVSGSDISLSQGVTFPKMGRAQRRLVMALLEASPRRRDVFRYRGLWLAVSRSIHAQEYQKTYPQAAAVLAELANQHSDSESLRSRFEALMTEGDVIGAAEVAGREAPGVLIRELRRVAGGIGDAGEFDRLCKVVAAEGRRVALRVLLAARAVVADNGATYPRMSFAKNGSHSRIDREAGHLRLEEDRRDQLEAAVGEAIGGALAEWNKDGRDWDGLKVWIDPACEQLLIPDGLRNTSDGVWMVERGSRFGAGETETERVLRLFVHWTEPAGERSDLDLSLLLLDDEFKPVGHVGWTNLAEVGAVHSGDLTSAPKGASEFIDVDLDQVRAAHRGVVRYLTPAILRYSGPKFSDLVEARTGWMLRAEANSDHKTFDPATVEACFELRGDRRYAVPFVYDLDAGEVVYLDAYFGGEAQAMIENKAGHLGEVVRAIRSRHNIKASVAELVRTHIRHRGGVEVAGREEAELVVAAGAVAQGETVDYDAVAPAKLISELL